MDDVRRFFRTLGIRITGAVTGMNPNRPGAAEVRKTLDPMLAEHYAQTIHIDNQSVLGIDRRAGQFREFMLKGAGVPWHREVLDCVQAFDREASKAEKLKMRVSPTLSTFAGFRNASGASPSGVGNASVHTSRQSESASMYFFGISGRRYESPSRKSARAILMSR